MAETDRPSKLVRLLETVGLKARTQAETDDHDVELGPINHHEDFRRAKRNALFWGGVCSLVAFALPAQASARFDYGTLGFGVPAWIIATALTATSLFSLVAFTRAQAFLVARHSQTVEGDRRTATAQQKIDKLIEHINEVQNTVAQIECDAKQEFAQLGHRFANVKQSLELAIRSPTHDESDEQWLDRLGYDNPGTRDIERKLFVDTFPDAITTPAGIARLLSDVQAYAKAIESGATAQIRAEARERLRLHRELQTAFDTLDNTRLPRHDRETDLLKAIGPLEDFSRNLRVFSSTIYKGELHWFRWWDLLPTYMIGAVGLLLLALRAFTYIGLPAVLPTPAEEPPQQIEIVEPAVKPRPT